MPNPGELIICRFNIRRPRSRILQPQRYMSRHSTPLSLKHGIKITHRVKHPSFTHRNRINKILNLFQWVPISVILNRVTKRTTKRHISTNRPNHRRPRPKPNRKSPSLTHARNTNAPRVDLHQRLHNPQRNHTILEETSKYPLIRIISALSKITPFRGVRLLMKSTFTVQVKAHTHHSLPSPIFIRKFRLSSIRRNPQKTRK